MYQLLIRSIVSSKRRYVPRGVNSLAFTIARFIDWAEMTIMPAHDRHAWEFHLFRKSNLALLLVDHQLQFILDKLADTPHYPLCRLL